MPKQISLKQDLLKILEDLDKKLRKETVARGSKNKNKLKAVITGGAAMVLTGYSDRATRDIDFIEASDEISKYLNSKTEIQDKINMRAVAYLLNFPEDYEDRLVKLDIGGQRIEYYAVSLEDIVISKIPSPRDKDMNDICNTEIILQINWELLNKLAEEREANALNAQDASTFRYLYKKYKEYAQNILERSQKCDLGEDRKHQYPGNN